MKDDKFYIINILESIEKIELILSAEDEKNILSILSKDAWLSE